MSHIATMPRLRNGLAAVLLALCGLMLPAVATAQVVVVANFSEFSSWGAGSDEYRVPNWPATPPGKRWREATQDRDVPPGWVGREALFPWEAKVYVLS